MKIEYDFLEKENIFIQKYIGNFTIEHYLKFMNFLIKTEKWKSVNKILSDFRNVDMQQAFDELDKLATFREKNIKKEYFNVFLVDNPCSTAVANLYQEKLNKYDYSYCSTLDYAINLLGLKKSKKELEYILNNLKNKY